MFVMFVYVSLSPAHVEIFAGLVDFDGSLCEAAHFGKTFGSLQFFLQEYRQSRLGGFCESDWLITSVHALCCVWM